MPLNSTEGEPTFLEHNRSDWWSANPSRMATRDGARMDQPIGCGYLPMGCLRQSASPLKVFAMIDGDVLWAQEPYMKRVRRMSLPPTLTIADRT
jgi:hypothetical protein